MIPFDDFGNFAQTTVLEFEAEPKRFYSYEPTQYQPKQPLVIGNDALAPKFIATWHRTPSKDMSIGISSLFVENATILREGQVVANGKLLAHSRILKPYVKKIVISGDKPYEILQKYLELPTRTINDPCILLFGHGSNVYGHFLVEMMLRILIGNEVCRTFGIAKPVYLLKFGTPKWLIDILQNHFGIDPSQMVFQRHDAECIILKQAIVPEDPIDTADRRYDLAIASMIQDLSRKIADGSKLDAQKYFITRSFFPSRKGRWMCENESELMEIAVKDYGFVPLVPEKLSWRNQILIFASAASVVGEFGSALHNSLFSCSDLTVGALGCANWQQSMIGALHGQRQFYLGPAQTGQFVVPRDDFVYMLERLG